MKEEEDDDNDEEEENPREKETVKETTLSIAILYQIITFLFLLVKTFTDEHDFSETILLIFDKSTIHKNVDNKSRSIDSLY